MNRYGFSVKVMRVVWPFAYPQSNKHSHNVPTGTDPANVQNRLSQT